MEPSTKCHVWWPRHVWRLARRHNKLVCVMTGSWGHVMPVSRSVKHFETHDLYWNRVEREEWVPFQISPGTSTVYNRDSSLSTTVAGIHGIVLKSLKLKFYIIILQLEVKAINMGSVTAWSNPIGILPADGNDMSSVVGYRLEGIIIQTEYDADCVCRPADCNWSPVMTYDYWAHQLNSPNKHYPLRWSCMKNRTSPCSRLCN